MHPLLIEREVHIDAPIAQVWSLIATEEGLRQWWGNSINLEAKEGGRCEEWRPRGQGMTHWQGVITHFVPPSQLTITLRAATPSSTADELSIISIVLEAKARGTTVKVTHRGFLSDAAVMPERDVMPQPQHQPQLPLAQLTQPPPGALPPATITAAPPFGQVVPLAMNVQRELLSLTWQRRLTNLTEAVHRTGAT